MEDFEIYQTRAFAKVIKGDLLSCLSNLPSPGHWCTAREFSKIRNTNSRKEKKQLWINDFWTANYAMIIPGKEENLLYFGEREANPIINNTKEFLSATPPALETGGLPGGGIPGIHLNN